MSSCRAHRHLPSSAGRREHGDAFAAAHGTSDDFALADAIGSIVQRRRCPGADTPTFMTRTSMSPAERMPAQHGFGHEGGPADDSRQANAAPAAPAVSQELADRFNALVDEVTDELMKGRPEQDRAACRADAIALLVATSKHLPRLPGAAESPLAYLLREEQQKMAALFGRTAASVAPLTFLKV